MQQVKILEREIARLKSAVEELSVLNKLALAVGSALTTDQVLNTIVHEAVKAVKAEQGFIKLFTPTSDRPLQTLIRQQNDDLNNGATYQLDDQITGWVLKTRQPLKIDDLANDARFKTTRAAQQGIVSLLCVPILMQAELLGILMVVNKRHGQKFSHGDLRLLSIMAAQSGQLIRNAKLQQQALEKEHLQRELELARQIQLSMLPKQNPQIEGLAMAHYIAPARTVGGDYYDFIPFSDHQLILVIADVSGHGPSAALVMTLLKGVVRSLVSNATLSAQTLQKINRIISQIIPAGMFITLQLMLFDLQKKRLFYANAGHNPALFYQAQEGTCRELYLASCALNILPDFSYLVQDFPLQTGDVIVAYTDGITEAMNAEGEMFGSERLSRLILHLAKHEPEQMVSQILHEIEGFTNHAEQSDDRALVVVKVQKV